MLNIALHFLAGTIGSLLLFLFFTRLSGTERFSAPFVVVFIGIACASLAHFLSPWATPAVLLAYALACANELGLHRAAKPKDPGGDEQS